MTTADPPRRRRVTYRDLVAGAFTRSVPISEDTKRLIRLRPGRFMDVTPEGEPIEPARARWASTIKTARVRTGRRYRVVTREGRLYVVCLKPAPENGEDS